jgi:hypothetical protein
MGSTSMLSENERRLLDQRIEANELEYEAAARKFLQARERAPHAEARRVATVAYLERARELGARLQGLYDLANADNQEWSNKP